MRMRALFGAVGVSVLASVVLASPASAADATLKIDRGATKADPDARATWHDKTDRLCVKAYTGSRAQAFVQRPNGQWVTVRDWVSQDNKGKCTGNLSIREDYKTKVVLDHFYNKRVKTKIRKIFT